MMRLSARRIAVLSIPALVCSTYIPAKAQEAPAPAEDMLETVIVTASLVKEDVQKTAVSMEVLSAEKLSEAGVTSVAEIAKFTPGLQLEQPGGGLTATVRIRGVGTPGFSALDPSVPIFIDGVAQARTGAGFQDLLDVERVEVLRGPQGTLYGRNSTAGAINVWTKKANTHDFAASAEIQAGNYDNRSGKISINVPLIDDVLAARLSGFKVKQDGYLTNGYTGQTGNGDADRAGARGKIGITPTDKLDIQIIGDYSENTTHPLDSLEVIPHIYNKYASSAASPAAGEPSEACGDPTGFLECFDDPYRAPHPAGIASHPNLNGIPLNAYGMPIDDKYNGKVYRDFDAKTFDRNVATSMTIKWDLSDALNVTSISAWNRYTTDQTLDLDHSILDFYVTHGHTETVSKSQELRLAGTSDHLDYVVGGYYGRDVVDSDNVTDGRRTDKISAADKYSATLSPPTDDTPGATSYAHSITNMDTKFKALFGQLTYKVGHFNFTGGLRRSWISKYADTAVYLTNFNTFTGAAVPCRAPLYCELTPRLLDHLTTDYTNTSGVFKVRYFLTEDWMLYASFDKGYKPGGYNRRVSSSLALNAIPRRYNEENSTNYEIGVKGSGFNRRLQIGLSVFHMDFKGFQNQTQTTDGDLLIENLAKVTSEGVELDVQALLTEGLTLGVGYAYLDPVVKENDPSRLANCHAPSGNPNYYCNGQRLFDVSQHTVNANLNYERTITDAGAQGFARVDWSWRSEYGISESRYGIEQDPVTLTNIRLGVRKLADHWTVTAWTKNVFNKEYASTGGSLVGGLPPREATSDGHFIVQGSPRTFGLTVNCDF
jgi:iron complex outermembrane recepter protein